MSPRCKQSAVKIAEVAALRTQEALVCSVEQPIWNLRLVSFDILSWVVALPPQQ